MDKLRLIVRTMNSQEKKDFRSFIQSERKLDKRKDLELFDLLYKEHDGNLEETLYGKSNKKAYHGVRKRLIKKLIHFIVLKRLEEDTTATSSVMGLISLSKYLFERRSDELAWIYLNNAETKAIENEQHDLLNSIYLLQIENFNSEWAKELTEIIEKKTRNKTLADEDERATIAYSLIKKELHEVVLQGKSIDFENVIKLVLTTYQLSNAIITRPKILFNILSISRSAILAKKDFYSFEPYIIGHYENAKEQFGFSKNSHFYKLSILYMISHVLYRNRKFDDAAHYLEEMKEALHAFNESHLLLFYSRYTLLLAGIKTYQGNLDEAVSILETGLSESADKFMNHDLIKLQLNLGLYYFLKEDYQKAIKTERSIGQTDNWLEKNLGKEWVFKKNIMEIIVQLESGHEDIAINKIRSLERTYTQLFSLPLYSRPKVFLSLIKKIINDPENFHTEEVSLIIEKNLTIVPEEQEDLQAMTFYAWLKAKLLKRNYYQVLLETVKPD